MTFLRKDPDALSNQFDALLRGIGHRGSSFTDIDAISHDMSTNRFLIMEWKREGEVFNWGQVRTLQALANLPPFTVWAIRVRDDGFYDFVSVPKRSNGHWHAFVERITSAELRQRYQNWWSNS